MWMSMPWFWLLLILLSLFPILFLSLKKSPKWFNFLFLPFFSFLSLLLYLGFGAFKPLQEKQLIDSLMAQMTELIAKKNITRAEVIDKLDQFSIEAENAPFALARLATLYQQLGLFDKAMELLARAIEISPQEDFQVEWIYTHSLKNQGKLDKEVRQIAQKLIENESLSLVLLNLLAMDDFFQGEYEKAIEEWQEILTKDQSLAQRRKVIEFAIEKAKLALADNKTKKQAQD